MSIERRFKDDDAVSPVVGVMLMLVVTIIIAGIVAAFATGVAGDTKSTPSAILSVGNINASNYDMNDFTLVHKGGDTLGIDNLKVQLTGFGATFTYDATKMDVLSPAIKSGDSIKVTIAGCYLGIGTPVSWSLIDTASGRAICTGNFVVE